jgi:hypothetical protein
MFDQLNRRGALVVIFLAAIVVGHPIVWASGWARYDGNPDSFPISVYPMFASAVPDVYPLHHIIATGPHGQEVRVPKSYWTVGGMNQARGQLEKAVRAYRQGGRPRDSTLHRFCTQAAQRIARRKKDASFAGTTKVQVVHSKYHLRKYFNGVDTSPVTRRRVMSCPIHRMKEQRKEAGHE